jgi:hypothetical protein
MEILQEADTLFRTFKDKPGKVSLGVLRGVGVADGVGVAEVVGRA